ncbi:DUF1616 domain-containing protein [Candidatus Dojkabacteria bacterium]|uniref:DUF1616 domain-containing protein n=1 Tax=Candidatus Dojkabacteria bacterium TaxID=2099670 RepID=A0A955HY30_9BACT|nr:DUF1616 domain-containing protein [Candidatus Dojkabacteria bacterium]
MNLNDKRSKYFLAAGLILTTILLVFKQTRGLVLLPYVFFLPGFLLSKVLFKRDIIDKVERVFISCLLSLTVIPLAVFNLSLLGVKINEINVLIISTVAIAVTLVILRSQNRKQK